MRRREVIAGLALPLLARAALAQQSPKPVIGYLAASTPEAGQGYLPFLRQGLAEMGFVEGRNVSIEYRWGSGDLDRLPKFVDEFLAQKVSLIVGWGQGSALDPRRRPLPVPIVTAFGVDPVKASLAESLSRPGGNFTGVYIFAYLLGSKRFEVLREAFPNAPLIALLVNPTIDSWIGEQYRAGIAEVESAAAAAGQKLTTVHASSEAELDGAYAAAKEQGASAVLAMMEAFFTSQRGRLIATAAKYALPTIWDNRAFVVDGGLMSYSVNLNDVIRRLGVQAGMILKGTKPGDIPIDQAPKIELVLNLKTAKALGLALPAILLARADEVIE